MKGHDVRVGAISLLALIAIPPWVLPWYRPGSQINCQHQAIDLTTGQMRTTRYLWYLKVSERVEDTWLSRTLADKPDGREASDWHRVNTNSPGRNVSPHSALHSAFAQMKQLEFLLNRQAASEEVRISAARGLLSVWRNAGSDHDVTNYLKRLEEPPTPTIEERPSSTSN